MQLTEKIRKIPPYIFAEIDKKKAEAQAKGIDIVDLGIGDPDLPTPKFIVDAMIEAVQDSSTHDYPPYQGTQEFRQAVASWYKRRFGVDLDPESEVISLIGSKEGIVHSFLTFLDPGDVALLPNPGYPAYTTGVILASGEPYMVPVYEENNYEPDLDSIPADILSRSKMLYLNYPTNPMGTVARDEFLQKAINWGKQHNILICMDLAYSEVYYNGNKPRSILEFEGAKDIAIEFHSLSKTFNMTGWRVGMAVGNTEAIQALGKIKTNVDSGVFKAIQVAAIHALENGDQFVEGQNDIYAKRCKTIVDALNDQGWNLPLPKASYYVWAPVPKGQTSAEFAMNLLETAGILVVPGTGYGSNGEGYFRISITTSEDRLEEAAKRLKEHNIRYN